MLAFAKCLLSGVAAVLLVWLVSVVVSAERETAAAKRSGAQGLTAIAGGWDYLLHKPSIIALLALAFAMGFWLCSRRL